MRSTEDEIIYWNTWIRFPPLVSIIMMLLLVSVASASWWATGCTESSYINGSSVNITYHICTANDTLVINHSMSVAVLVIGGGAGAGGSSAATASGGGGAGGYLFNSSYAITAGNYPVVVGVGGLGGSGVSSGGLFGQHGENGTNSSFGSMIAIGGGGGVCYTVNATAGKAGASGGGGAYESVGGAAVGIPTQGTVGGNGNPGSGQPGGGGGGSNLSDGGWIGTAFYGGKGGSGEYNNITGVYKAYACGGGGGVMVILSTPGYAGCNSSGAGNVTNTAGSQGNNATSNMGGGGGGIGSGGGGMTLKGGNGGNGTVIISYPTASGSSLITATLISPTDGSNYSMVTVSVPITFNCSGNSNGNYLANLTVNNVSYNNATAITAVNNASTPYTINSSVGGVFTWGVLCYNSTTLAYSPIYTFTINNTSPVITVLAINPNGSVYRLGPVYANVTAQDADNTSMTIYYTWYLNGVNTSAGSMAYVSPLAVIDAGVSSYTAGDNWSISVYAYDGSVSSSVNMSANTTILEYASGVIANYTTPQYDTQAYTHTLNLTTTTSNTMTAVLEYDGVNHPSVDKGVGAAHVFEINATPSQVSVPGAINFTWHYITTISNGSTFTQNLSYSITVLPSGLLECNASIANISLNFTFLDFTTGTPVNTTYTSTYASSGVNRTIIGAASSYVWCIEPSIATFVITTTETYAAAVGYSTIYTSRSLTANNVTQTIYIYMVNASSAYPTTLTVQQLPNIPLTGIKIDVYRFTPPNNYTALQTCTTNTAGSCLVYLIPNTISYLYNLTNLGMTAGPETLACTPGSAICYRNFFIGTVVDIPGVTSGKVSGACSYSNTTGYLTCTAQATIPEVTGFGLKLYRLGANTTTCLNTSAGLTSTLTCGVPQINNSIWSYFLYSIETGHNEPITGGEIDINLNRATALGRDAWFITLFLFLFMAAVGAVNPVLGIFLGLLGLMLAIFIQIIPFNSMFSIFMITAIMGLVLVWRIRV